MMMSVEMLRKAEEIAKRYPCMDQVVTDEIIEKSGLKICSAERITAYPTPTQGPSSTLCVTSGPFVEPSSEGGGCSTANLGFMLMAMIFAAFLYLLR